MVMATKVERSTPGNYRFGSNERIRQSNEFVFQEWVALTTNGAKATGNIIDFGNKFFRIPFCTHKLLTRGLE